MTVVELWSAFKDWTPFTAVEVYDTYAHRTYDYSYYEDAIKDFGDSSAVTFSYNSADNKISIDLQ